MNEKNKQNIEKSKKVAGESKSLPLTYLVGQYVDGDGKPVDGCEPVSNTVFFSEGSMPARNESGFYDNQGLKLISRSTRLTSFGRNND